MKPLSKSHVYLLMSKRHSSAREFRSTAQYVGEVSGAQLSAEYEVKRSLPNKHLFMKLQSLPPRLLMCLSFTRAAELTAMGPRRRNYWLQSEVKTREAVSLSLQDLADTKKLCSRNLVKHVLTFCVIWLCASNLIFFQGVDSPRFYLGFKIFPYFKHLYLR